MASKALTSNFGGVLSFVESHATTFLNGVTTLFTVLVEGLVSENLFSCPCLRYEDAALDRYLAQTASRWKAAYSLVFMLLPVIVLFCISLAVNNETNRCLAIKRRHCDIRQQLRSFRYLVMKSSSALVAPAAWLFVVFIDGRYLECAVTELPTNCLPTDDTQVTTNVTVLNILADRRNRNQYYLTLSQIIALAGLAFGILLATTTVLCARLCDRTTYYQQEYMTKMRKAEMEAFHETADKIITKDLAKTWEKFFHSASEDDWHAISELPYGEPDVIDGKAYYSAFHRWSGGKELPPDAVDGVPRIVVNNAEEQNEVDTRTSKSKRSSRHKKRRHELENGLDDVNGKTAGQYISVDQFNNP